MNFGVQLGPLSITKLSPNWACQMGPIYCPKFLLSGKCLGGMLEWGRLPISLVYRETEWSFYGAASRRLYAFLGKRFVHPRRHPLMRVTVAYPHQTVVLDL